MRRGCITFGCALLLLLSGCALAQPAESEAPSDRLVGVLITRESLGEDRLYAREAFLEDDPVPEVSFPAGVALYCARYRLGDGPLDYLITSGERIGVSESQLFGGGDIFEIRGRIYVLPGEDGITCFFNPIYQDAEERLYAVPGIQMESPNNAQGYCMQWESGERFGTFEERMRSEESDSYICAEIWGAYQTERVRVLQMDGENKLLSEAEYAPEAMPERITTETGAAYIVTETYVTEVEGAPEVTRALYEPDSEELVCRVLREDGFFVEQNTSLNWT